jgi:hypothetical protein
VTADIKPGDPADRAPDAKADGAFQGSHRAGYGDEVARVEEWLRKHPSATLESGWEAVLLAEIVWLRMENDELRSIRLNMGRGINKLRAAIDRVRALHRPTLEGAHCVVCHSSDSSDWDFYPCPTLRALDGDA